MWWDDGDADLERGLDVGSSRAIFDQHFYQRGRFGRTLSTLATADERFGGASPVGVGVDYATGIRDTGDTLLSGLFGDSSVAVVDLETLGRHPLLGRQPGHPLRPQGADPPDDRRHHLRPGRPHLHPRRHRGRAAVGRGRGRPRHPPRASAARCSSAAACSAATSSATWSTAARAVSTSKTAKLVVLGGGAGSSTLANSYAQAVKKAGWGGTVTTVVHGSKGWSTKTLAGATAVVLAGDDPAALASTMADPAFRDAVTSAVRTTPVVLADGAMTAVLGARWSAKANAPEADLDAIEAEGVAAFRADDAAWLPGLGLVPATLVPHLTDDYRWGRLYAGVTTSPRAARGRRRRRLGRRAGARPVPRSTGSSVVVADGRGGTYWTGANGAMGASGVVLDVFGDGEALHR